MMKRPVSRELINEVLNAVEIHPPVNGRIISEEIHVIYEILRIVQDLQDRIEVIEKKLCL